jgi:hypothetical protein
MNLTDAVMNAIETNAAKKAPGRPTVEGSARQQKLAAMEARKQANGGEIRLGRPAVADSKRQKELAEKAARLANGYIPKKGRPSFASQGLLTKKEAVKTPTAPAVSKVQNILADLVVEPVNETKVEVEAQEVIEVMAEVKKAKSRK